MRPAAPTLPCRVGGADRRSDLAWRPPIVVAGVSVGGLGALAFGARRDGLAGIIGLAANGSPEQPVRLLPQIAESLAQA